VSDIKPERYVINGEDDNRAVTGKGRFTPPAINHESLPRPTEREDRRLDCEHRQIEAPDPHWLRRNVVKMSFIAIQQKGWWKVKARRC